MTSLGTPPELAASTRLADPAAPKFTEHFNTSTSYKQYLASGEDAPIPRYDYLRGYPTQHHQFSQSDLEEKEVVPAHLSKPLDQDELNGAGRTPRICGIPRFWAYLLFFTLLALAIGLGAGLVVATRHKRSLPKVVYNPNNSIGGYLDPSYYSTTGAFNGSGIALASQSFTPNLEDGTRGSIVLYFQHWTGQIRWKQLSSNGEWLGGDISTVVASDAKNSTPISAVSYNYRGVSSWHIFYVDRNNILRQRSNSNTTNVWVDGAVNKMNLPVLNAQMVGMQACWYGNQYGDIDYVHTPLANGRGANSTRSQDVGMHLWYAKDSTTFQQLGWRAGDDTWEFQQTFHDKNGHAGVGCYSWGPGTVTYLMFVNLENSVEFWWKDTASNVTPTESHPINQWTNSSIAINGVHPSSSLGYTNFFYVQDAATSYFKGYNISWAAENTRIEGEDNFTVQGDPGIPGSHLSVSAIPQPSGGNDLIVFYQTNGSDISEYTRDLVAGQWSGVEIPIPQG